MASVYRVHSPCLQAIVLATRAEVVRRPTREAAWLTTDTRADLADACFVALRGEQFDGQIRGVTKSGLFVALPQFGADGFIPVSTLGRDYYIYDEAHQALTGEKSGLGYQLGDTVEVKLVEAVPLAGALRFEMLSEGRKMPAGTRSFHKAGRRGQKQPGTRPPRSRR